MRTDHVKLREVPTLGRKLAQYWRDPRVALWRKLTGLFAMLYLVSPIDLVPDAMPVVGWLDDLGVLTAVALFMVREIRRYAPPPEEPPRSPEA